MNNSDEAVKRAPMALRIAPWLGCIMIIGLIILATTQWDNWNSDRRIQSTQNAFVETHLAVLSAKASGYIKHVAVRDYQHVQAGQLIAQIYDDDYALEVAVAKATLAKAQAHLDSLDKELAQQQARIKQAQAGIRAAKSRVQEYRNNPARRKGLIKKGALSRQLYERAQADFEHASSQLDAATAEADLAHKSLKVLQAQRAQRIADVHAAQAHLGLAQRNLRYTHIVAPFDGVLGRLHIQVGSLVATGTSIVSLVPDSRPFIIANYKETQLAHVQIGQPVELTVDGLPDARFHGRVTQIAPMSGAKASLLPADNASGNFTKVVQRIPVRIDLAPGQQGLERLRAGMSVETSIDTEGKVVSAYSKADLRTAQPVAVAAGEAVSP